MGSSSITSGWGVVSSLFDRFGNSGSMTSVHAVRACLIRWSRLSKFRPHFLRFLYYFDYDYYHYHYYCRYIHTLRDALESPISRTFHRISRTHIPFSLPDS